MNGKILTICIPTYNRSSFIKEQLSFFQKQFLRNNNLLDQVYVVVADNASTDNTCDVVTKYKKKTNFFHYIQNTENLGLVGNILNLLKHCEGDYVWFVSDDDTLKDGVIENLLNIIKNNNNPEYIFLNYNNSGRKGFKGRAGYRSDSKEAAIEVFNEAYGSLVFMSSCVYKRAWLQELSENGMYNWISVPMLFSFYCCSKGPIYLCDEAWVDFYRNNASYSSLKRVLKIKFEEYISILEYLPSIGYDIDMCKNAILKFFEKQVHAHFLYNFINIRKSLRLYRYYKLKTILKLPLNILKYLGDK